MLEPATTGAANITRAVPMRHATGHGVLQPATAGAGTGNKPAGDECTLMLACCKRGDRMLEPAGGDAVTVVTSCWNQPAAELQTLGQKL